MQAAQYLVRQLTSQVDRKDVSIDVAVAGFADAFKVYRRRPTRQPIRERHLLDGG